MTPSATPENYTTLTDATYSQPFGNPLKKEEILHVMASVKSPKK